MARRRRPLVFDDASPALDRFGLLLGLTVSSIVVFSLVDLVGSRGPELKELLSIGATAVAAVTLLLALRASGLARHWQHVADVVLAVVIGALLLANAFRVVAPEAAATVPRAQAVVVAVLALLAPVAVVRRLLRHRRVTSGTMLGAVAGYLMIPLAYFYLFLLADAYVGQPFFGQPEPSPSFMYFSLATVSTVGYGDLVPATDLDRLLATSEALLGQLYLVTFVALLVGLFTANRQRGFEPQPPATAVTSDDDSAPAPGES